MSGNRAISSHGSPVCSSHRLDALDATCFNSVLNLPRQQTDRSESWLMNSASKLRPEQVVTLPQRDTNELDVAVSCAVAPAPPWCGVKAEKTVDVPGGAASAPAAKDADRLQELMLSYQNADPD